MGQDHAAKPPEYYHVLNRSLLAFLPAGLQRVLEIGCGGGALGQAYKAANAVTRWYGMEIVAEAEQVARQRLDGTWCGDFETAAPNAFGEEAFDAVVLADVLEHFRDPYGALTRLAKMLRPDGRIFICLPNVQHWSVIRDLLLGRWDYRESGILDNTHLRFFTLDSFLTEIARLGLVARGVSPLIPADNAALIEAGHHKDRILRLIGAALGPEQLDREKSKFLAYQYLIALQPDGQVPS